MLLLALEMTFICDEDQACESVCVAGAVLGEGQVSLFVAGAVLGEGQVSLFVVVFLWWCLCGGVLVVVFLCVRVIRTKVQSIKVIRTIL